MTGPAAMRREVSDKHVRLMRESDDIPRAKIIANLMPSRNQTMIRQAVFQHQKNTSLGQGSLMKIDGVKGLSELPDRRGVPHTKPYTKSINDDARMAALMALDKLSRLGASS